MLKSIYNWIRYKTITPSFYAKNRLFIERGDKHRRIFSNLGLVFRNSKWASYVKENLSFSSYASTLSSWRNTAVLSFLIALISLLPNFLWPTELQDWTFAQVWYLVDEVTRTALLVLFTIYWNVTQQLEELFSFAFNTSKEKPLRVSKYNVANLRSKKLTKGDKKDLVYKLTNDINPSNDSYLATFYQSNPSSSHSSLFNVYSKVFNPSTMTNHYSNNTFWHDYNLENSTRQPLPSTALPLVFSSQQLDLKTPKLTPKPSLWFLNHESQWGLDSISGINSSSNHFNPVVGQYILSSRDVSQSLGSNTKSPLLLSLTPSLKEQTNWIKLSRWLSRYSILHRRTIADSHKLTMSKRLIGSGFYDSSLDTLNINNSSVKALNENWANLYQSLFTQSYGNFFDPYTTNNLLSTKKTAELAPNFTHLLSFHEDSLSWVTKRFYLFNNLSSNSNNFNFRPRLDPVKSVSSVTSEQNIDNFLSLQNTLLPSLTRFDTAAISAADTSEESKFSQTPLSPFVIHDVREELFSLDYSESAMLMLQKPSYFDNQQLTWGSSLNLTDSFFLQSTSLKDSNGLMLTPNYKEWEGSDYTNKPTLPYSFVSGSPKQARRTDIYKSFRSQATDYTKPFPFRKNFLKKN